MPKAFYIIFTIIICPLIAGIYGILHDQITYTISEEYYTKFKFLQFGLTDIANHSPRLGAMAVGWKASWWTGIPAGIILSVIVFIKLSRLNYFQIIIPLISIILATTLLAGIVGYIYGSSSTNIAYWVWENISDKRHFFITGCIHNATYIGGIVGLITSIFYSYRL